MRALLRILLPVVVIFVAVVLAWAILLRKPTVEAKRHTIATQAVNRGMSLERWPPFWATARCA